MARSKLHKFAKNGKYFVFDPHNTFCFECDEITYQIVDYYPDTPLIKVINELSSKYSEEEIKEVWGELEFLRVTGLILKKQKLETWIKEVTEIPSLTEIVFGIDHSLVNDGSLGEVVCKGVLKSLPYLRKDKLSITIMSLDSYPSLDDSKRVIDLIRKYFPLSEKQVSLSLVIPLPYEFAEKWKLSTSSKIFAHVPLNSSEPKIKKIEIYPTESDLLRIIKKLVENNITNIEIHFDVLYSLEHGMNISDIFAQIHELSDYYAQMLKKSRNLIINPLTDMFNRIQKGIPKRISDPAGVQKWFVSPSGEVYGGYIYYLNKLGKIGTLDELDLQNNESLALLNRGGDIIPTCINCWAKNLCGGGTPIIHYRFTKKFNQPYEEWCNAQRDWIESMIARFQELGDLDFASFGKMQELEQRDLRPSKFSILKHVFQSFFSEKLMIRLVSPKDDALLARWENWNTATYYAFFENTALTTTMFEKEQEILNPQRGYEEFVVVDAKGNPRGLIRIKPDKVPNLYYVWVYLNNPDDYDSRSVIKNFQDIISYVRNFDPSGKYLFPVKQGEEKLSLFFEKLGMKKIGTFRESVYYHGLYHDVEIYAL